MMEKTMIVSDTFGTFYFDAVFNVSHQVIATVSEHQVQSGASIADHAFIEPIEIPINVGMSDVATDVNTIAGSSTDRSVVAFQRLCLLMEAFEPVTLVTRLQTYENMLITSVAAEDDYKTQQALKAAVVFRQLQIVDVSTVEIQDKTSSSKGGSGKSSSGSKASSATTTSSAGEKASVFYKILN